MQDQALQAASQYSVRCSLCAFCMVQCPVGWVLRSRVLTHAAVCLQICVAYKTPDGRELKSSMPADVETVEQVEPVYETLPGWKSDISNVRTWNDLPQAARDYVQRCEDLMGVPVKWIGVGPGRDAIVVKP